MKQYSFYNLPKKLKRDEYVKAQEKVVRKYSSIRNISSIYSWGSISVPGISDLDIVLVHKLPASKLPMLKRTYLSISAKDRYMLYHPCVHIDEESFRAIRYMNPHPFFELLFGKELPIQTITKNEEKQVYCALLSDIIIRHYPRDFIYQKEQQSIDVRNTLLRLNSLRYTIDILSNVFRIKKPEWNVLSKDVQSLRTSWFEKKPFSDLVSLNDNALLISLDIVDMFSDLLKKEDIVKLRSKKQVTLNALKNKTLFIHDWNKEKCMEMNNRLSKDKKIVLPLVLAAQLFEYTKFKGIISDHIHKHLEGTMQYDLSHANIIKKRSEILNAQALLAQGLAHSDFPAFFDFGYRTKSGLNNVVIRIMDSLR